MTAVSYKIHIVLTDNGVQFTHQPSRRYGPRRRATPPSHMVDLRCRAHGVEHRLTKPNHPWTTGQVERMNRTLKEAAVRRYHAASRAPLSTHLQTLPRRL